MWYLVPVCLCYPQWSDNSADPDDSSWVSCVRIVLFSVVFLLNLPIVCPVFSETSLMCCVHHTVFFTSLFLYKAIRCRSKALRVLGLAPGS